MTGFQEVANGTLLMQLNCLWQSAVIAGGVWLALRVFRGPNAATRHAIWWTVLGAVLLLPLMKSTRRESSPKSALIVLAPARTAAPAASTAAANSHQVRAGNAPSALMIGWGLMAGLFLLQLGFSYRRVRGIVRRCRPVPDPVASRFRRHMAGLPGEVLASDEIVSPMACGFRRPAVILPASLLREISDAELDHILLHEIAHLKRGDQWSNLLARLAGAVLAIHPVALFVLRNIERERELACDEWVVAATGAPRPYAATLARLFELCRLRRSELLATGMADRSSRLGERIETLLDAKFPAQPRTSLRRVALSVVVLLACIGAGASAPSWIAYAQTAAPKAGMRVGPARPGSLLAALVASGYGDMQVDDIISLKNHGVGADYIRGIKDCGWGKLSAQEIVDLHNHGVSPEYTREVKEAGLEAATLRDAIELHQRGVRPELFHALKEHGFKNVTVQEVIEAQDCGLGAGNLQEARQYGTQLTLKQVVRLKRAGVI